MIVKIVFLFLIGIAVLAMFGRIKLPGQSKLEAMRCNAVAAFDWAHPAALADPNRQA